MIALLDKSMATDVRYVDLPKAVRKNSNNSEGDSVPEESCCLCENDFYLVQTGGERLYVNTSGNVEGQGNLSGMVLKEPGAMPRQLDGRNGHFACGSCLSPEVFRAEGYAVFVDGIHYPHLGVFVNDTVVTDSYLTDDRAIKHDEMMSAIKQIVTQKKPSSITLEDYTLKRVSSNSVMVAEENHQENQEWKITSHEISEGNVPVPHPCMSVDDDTLYIPRRILQ